MAELPVTMSGLSPIITAKINGADAQFIADSGAFYSVISPGSAAAFNLPLKAAPAGFHMTGIGGNADVSVATVRHFMLDTVPLANVQFIVGGSEIGGAGVIGQNVWGFADVEYDLPHGAIRLMRAIDCGHANLAYWANGRAFSIVPIEDRTTSRQHTVGIVRLNGIKIRATFDTGAPASMLSLATAARLGIKPGGPGVLPGGSLGGFGRKRVPTWIAPIESFETDGEKIAGLHLRIGELPGDTEMLIGADFFIAHRVYVANGVHALFFTYEGGPVFDTRASFHDETAVPGTPPAAAAADTPEPPDADGFSRRGAVYASRHDLPHAIADFTRAIALAPAEPRYLQERAIAYLASGQREAAAADLDNALTLKPDDVRTLLARAQMRLGGQNESAAAADLDAAAKAAPRSADERLDLASLYGAIGRREAAIAQYDLWIASHPDDSRRPQALNGRCWARALLGIDLRNALSDCDAAVRAYPRNAPFLDSRGLVHLRLGEDAKAIADYDAALALNPRIAWSLYGRGIAKLHKGMKTEGAADIAAAATIAPRLPEEAKRAGIQP